VYAEFTLSGRRVESWLPVLIGHAGTTSKTRDLYLPAGKPDAPITEIGSGIAIYTVGLALLGLSLILVRRMPRPTSTA
jgi:hypothetical protein